MPSKAKLVTRASSSSTVSTDTIPKNNSLTHAELDSNLINLRDATFGVASDDSTVIDVGMGNTLKVAGSGGVTTAVSGQTLTITGSSGSITLVGDDSTGTAVTVGETFKIAGGHNITTAVSGDTLTITGSKNIDVNEINSGDSSAIQINDAVNISGTLNAKTIVTNDLISEDSSAINVLDGMNVSGTLSADVLDVNELSSNDSTAIQINDAVNISGAATINNTLAVTSTSTFTGDATFLGFIKGDTNGPVTIAPDGTGDVQLVADTVQIGDSNTNATLTTNGTGDLILNTNSGTNSGSITVADGANGDIKILVNGTGMMDILKEINVTNFPQTPSLDNSNWAGYDSPTYVGTRQLYSNLAQGNITDPTERVRANTRFTVIKHPNDSTTYNDNDYVIQNTDFTVVDINGQNFAQTSRGAGARGEANNCVLINTAGGTVTGTNIAGGSAFVEVDAGHGGDLTCANAMGFRSFISNRANTGEFTRITNAYGYVAEGLGTGGTGANGTNRFITNEFGYFSQGATGTSLVTNYYGFYANTGANATNKYAFYSADDAYLSRLGTIERFREKVSALTFSASIAVNTDLAPIFTVTLTGNTDFTLNNLSTGQTVTIIVTQDGTGSRTATFSTDTSTAVKFAAGSATLSTAANAIDVVRIVNTGTNFIGILDKGFA